MTDEATPEQIKKAAETRIEEIAVEIRKASNYELTREQAYVRALDGNPDLVRGLYGMEPE